MNTTKIVDLCYLSDTMPEIPEHSIPRDNYLDAIEQGLKDKDVFFISAEEGTGVTTLLALFANYHHYNCVSYFNNGLNKLLLDPEFIEHSLIKQLYFYIDRQTVLSDEEVKQLSLQGLYLQLGRKRRTSKDPLYFIFDGFDDIPSQSRENIRIFMESLPWDKGKFIFSGKYENLKEFLPRKIKCIPDQTLQKFSKYEVVTFLKQIEPNLSEDDFNELCRISGCVGSQLRAMLSLYDKHHSFKPILELDDNQINDLYAYNFSTIEQADNCEDSIKVLALVAFINIRLTKDAICQTLSMDIDRLTSVLETCADYLLYRDNYVVFYSECNQRYVKRHLAKLQHEMELLFIQQFKSEKGNLDVESYMPVLLKDVNDKKGLVDYLNSDVMLNSVERRQTQAALNEQCELGFASSDYSDLSQMASTFRFALNKSASREIEQNELWDYQIDALMSVGYYEKAYSLAQSVYLKEERLKAFLLIARWGKKFPISLMDEVRMNINSLVSEIDFEHIPDKSMELVKLLFPYDYKIAVDIIDRIAKVSKNRAPIDKLYSLLSISSGQEKDLESNAKFDVLASKIENNDIRRMTKAARSIFNNTDVDSILKELKELPSPQQALYLLQYWIPEQTDIDGIGKIVLYAIQSVMSISNIERPKVTLISDFCSALPNMAPSDIEQVVVLIDSFQTSLLAPSEEYVRMELKLVEALFKFNENLACERLQNLYLLVDDFENKSTSIACKSIILGKYNSLGHSELLASSVMSPETLQKEIEEDISNLFRKTAYHLKIVEQPIRSLVVNYKSSVMKIISQMNTLERRSRAYMIAADSYISEVKPDAWDWQYLTSLVEKINYDSDDCSTIVTRMANEIMHMKTINSDFLSNIKKYHNLFFNVEKASSKCRVLASLYVLFKKSDPNDTFSITIHKELSKCWDTADLLWYKLDNGYLIAKTIAKASVDEAIEWIRKVSSIQDGYPISSASSVAAFRESIDLYNRTLGVLIRSDVADDKILHNFENNISVYETEGEQIISWSKIALYYYLKNNMAKFDEIFTKHVSKDLDNYSVYFKKYIIYNSAPALYLGSKNVFYAQLEKLDGLFKDACISKVAKFIFVKYVEVDDAEPFRGEYDLSGRDFDNLADLLNHCIDDSTFFGIYDSVCKSLKISKNGVSLDQKKHVVKLLSDMIEIRLPMKDFIQHDGYKVACQISLSNLSGQQQNRSLYDGWEKAINKIDNSADQAFLYVHAAHYTIKTERRQHFIRQATSLIATIPSTFDKSSRIDLCIDECRESTKGLAESVVKQFMEIMYADKNGDVSDIKRAYDCIYDYSPILADIFLERMDNDPARNYYRHQLQNHSKRAKRIESAKDKLSNISNFSRRDQQMFFAEQLANQIKQTSAVYDVQSTMDIMPIIYNYAISDVHDALNYFLENVYRKHQISKNQTTLMHGLHEAALVNLKLVMALSSGTKEKLTRISQAISESYAPTDPSLTLAGEKKKAVDCILNWYKEHPYDNLFIIDAFFSPKDFYLIKMLMNINVNLSLTIITHRKNVKELADYQTGWDKVSSDLIGSIIIHTICYDSKPSDGPLHARWWLCIDEDDENRVGIKLNSISGLGKKDEDISAIEDSKLSDIENLAMNYALGKKKRVGDDILKYESFIIR